MLAGRILTGDERERFLAEFSPGNRVTRYRTPHRDYVLCRLVLATGLWVGEIVALRWRHVDLAQRRLAVIDEAGWLDRTVPFDPDLADLLRGWREEDNPERDPDTRVFTTMNDTAMDRRAVWEMVRRRGEKAGIEGRVTPTVLRDTFAANLLRRTGNLRHVQKALGHERLESTKRRYRPLIEELPGLAV